jgi:NADH dehydrogenase
MDEVQGFDLSGRRLLCRDNTLEYDYLVLGFGGITSYFGHPEWAGFAPGLKTLEDALLIRRNVLLAFERAETLRNPDEQGRLMTIVVVGGGPTGVELAGACAELAHRVLRRDFEHIDPRRARIILIEALPRILTQFPEDLSAKARRQLENLGVEVRTSCPVKNIGQGAITLANDEVIAAENILWGAGVMANPLTTALGVELDRAGRIKVNPDLSLPGHPEVFAVGDIASVIQKNGKPVPGVAPAAMQMARHVARTIREELDHVSTSNRRQPFRYHDKGTLATIGRSAGIAQIGRIKLEGFLAWFAWLVVHLIFLIGFRNKIAVLVSWTYSYFTYRLGARIITGWPLPTALLAPPPPAISPEKPIVSARR